jgi:hypothetical protein
MSIFKSIKYQFRPPKIDDPDFGQLTFMYISNNPERSYWEAEWLFPSTGTTISIALDGDESGPKASAREWHLGLPARFKEIVELAKPELAKVLKSWLHQDIPADIFKVVKLAGFGVVDPSAQTIDWDVSFETIGDKWLGIVIPFHGTKVKDAIVDT